MLDFALFRYVFIIVGLINFAFINIGPLKMIKNGQRIFWYGVLVPYFCMALILWLAGYIFRLFNVMVVTEIEIGCNPQIWLSYQLAVMLIIPTSFPHPHLSSWWLRACGRHVYLLIMLL